MPHGDEEKNPYRVLDDDYEPPIFETEKPNERPEFVGRIAPDNPWYMNMVDHGKMSYWLMLPASIAVAAIIVLAGMSVGLISPLSGGDGENDHSAVTLSLGVPETIRPFDGDMISSPTPELIWIPVPYADSYNVELWHEGSQTANLTISSYRLRFSVPLDDASYNWRVRAVNGTTYGNWSAVSTFMIRASLNAPELVAPENNAMVVNNPLAFSWSDDGVSDVWRVRVADDPEFESILLDVMVSAASLTVPLDLEENATYYWCVMAGWQDIWSEWSETSSFTKSPKTITIEHQWTFIEEEWSMNITISIEDYAEAMGYTRSLFSPSSYGVFVTPDQQAVVQIANYLMNESDSMNLIPTMRVWLAMTFVQSYSFADDDDTHGVANYANFPVETLVEGRGDCEDHAALFVSIVRAMGFDAIQIYMTDGAVGHMSAGVVGIDVLPSISSYISYQGKQYWFCETAGQYYLPGLSPVNNLQEWSVVPVP